MNNYLLDLLHNANYSAAELANLARLAGQSFNRR